MAAPWPCHFPASVWIIRFNAAIIQALKSLTIVKMVASTCAATLTFAWDPVPPDQNWIKVRLYEKSGTTYTLLIEVAGTATQATITNVTPGTHSFVARSFDGTWESGDSNVVVTGPVLNPLGNFKILTLVLASVGTLASLLLLMFRRR
jgi:hypothetical protein